MDDQSINEVVAEIEPLLAGRAPGKIFQLGPFSLAIDFRLRILGYLFVGVDPAQPQLYLGTSRDRNLSTQIYPLSQPALTPLHQLSDPTHTNVKLYQHSPST